MIALFFEVTPKPGQEDRYLEIAGSLKTELDGSGGLTFLNRYRSIGRPRTMLSHQIWRDEARLARWRAHGRHYRAQVSGRHEVFDDYRLRVGSVVASVSHGSGVLERPASVIYNDPSLKTERWMAVLYATSDKGDHAAMGEVWRSVYNETELAVTAEVGDRGKGLDLIAAAIRTPCILAAHLVLVSRDYGMFDRAEAPQYFPPVQGA